MSSIHGVVPQRESVDPVLVRLPITVSQLQPDWLMCRITKGEIQIHLSICLCILSLSPLLYANYTDALVLLIFCRQISTLNQQCKEIPALGEYLGWSSRHKGAVFIVKTWFKVFVCAFSCDNKSLG